MTATMRPEDLRITVVVESKDSFAYAASCAFLHRLVPSAEALVTLVSSREHGRKVVLLTNSSSGTAWYNGCQIDYAVEVSEEAVSTDGKPEPFRRLRLRGTRAVLLAFVTEALDIHRKVRSGSGDGEDDDLVPYWTWDEDSGLWCRSKAKRARPLSTLFLTADADQLVADFRHFCSEESVQKYASLHATPTRIYMLHGRPGAGKTSTVHCVASEMRFGVATLTFGPGTTDADVQAALGSLPARCLVCIEDVDCLFGGADGRASLCGVSFAGLLNALDNCGGYDGATGIFLTTNRLCALDPALKRRIDYVLEFGAATKSQAARMFAQFFPYSLAFEQFWQRVHGRDVSMSVLQKYFLKALQSGDPLRDFEQFEALASVASVPAGDLAHMYA